MRDAIVELGERELLAREDDDLLGEPREVHERERAGVQQVAHEVAIGDRVDACSRTSAAKPSSAAVHGGIERQARAGERAGAERRDVGRVVGAAQPLVVARERPGVRGEVVAEQHRLGALQVRVARQHERRARRAPRRRAPAAARRRARRAAGRRPWPRAASRPRPGRCASAPRARGGRAARAARRAGARGSCGRPRPARRRSAARARASATASVSASAASSRPCRAEHADVHDRGAHVVGEQRPVDRQRARELEQDRVETARQAARPERAARGGVSGSSSTTRAASGSAARRPRSWSAGSRCG